jgi:hypothetical protein
MSTPRHVTIAMLVITLASLTAVACSQGYHEPVNLGVLPPQPPQPLWLGAVHPTTGDTALGEVAAVTSSSTPSWSHVLVSIKGAQPFTTYAWRLHSGTCSASGPIVGPDDRYTPLVPFADGTAASETTIPVVLAPTQPYSVVVMNPSGNGASACADLTYGSM